MPNNFRISPAACITGALLLLTLPLPWLLAALIAAGFHELCHWAALRLCGVKDCRLHIGSTGAIMEAAPLSCGKELLCALAGPMGSLSLLLLARWLPRIAVCAAFHTLYNLLPLYPLDGGRALRCGVRMLLPPKAAAITSTVTEKFCLAAICLVALYASFSLHLGLLPMITALLLLLKRQKAKIPCKPTGLGVQ